MALLCRETPRRKIACAPQSAVSFSPSPIGFRRSVLSRLRAGSLNDQPASRCPIACASARVTTRDYPCRREINSNASAFNVFASRLPCSLVCGSLRSPRNPSTPCRPSCAARSTASPRRCLTQTGVPSASIAVVQHGKLVYTHAYGCARLAAGSAPAVPATPDMRYSIGSISKQFTAAAILMLQQEGKLSLDDPVGKYIPGLTRGNEVTIREILSHTSGYQDYWPEDYVMTTMLRPDHCAADHRHLGQKAARLRARHAVAIFEHQLRYRRRIVEVVSGEPLLGFSHRAHFPAAGNEFGLELRRNQAHTPDATRLLSPRARPTAVAPKEGAGWMFAAGELAMTPHDLALWDESLIAQSLLKPESYKEMFTEVKLKNGEGTHYGLGVDVRDRNGHRSIEHSRRSLRFRLRQ